MIYGNAGLEVMPWELLIKKFRSELGSHTFARIDGYFDYFVKYLEREADSFLDWTESLAAAAYFSARDANTQSDGADRAAR
jgi:hypothetical protein